MLKKLSTLSKGYLITIFMSLFIALFVITFFLIRVKQIDRSCFNQISSDMDNEAWPEFDQLTSDQAQKVYEAQLLYIITEHRKCVENKKFFYFF